MGSRSCAAPHDTSSSQRKVRRCSRALEGCWQQRTTLHAQSKPWHGVRLARYLWPRRTARHGRQSPGFWHTLASVTRGSPSNRARLGGGEIGELLLSDRFNLATAPRTSYSWGFHTPVVRREPLRIALSRTDRLPRRQRIELAMLADRLFEIWPREMAPGLFDTIVGYCRAARVRGPLHRARLCSSPGRQVFPPSFSAFFFRRLAP